MKLVKTLHSHITSIICIQETEWVDSKVRIINRTRNKVGMMVSEKLVDQVVEIRHKTHHIMSIKLVVCSEILTVASAYTP